LDAVEREFRKSKKLFSANERSLPWIQVRDTAVEVVRIDYGDEEED
jgi:hypothetical protein